MATIAVDLAADLDHYTRPAMHTTRKRHPHRLWWRQKTPVIYSLYKEAGSNGGKLRPDAQIHLHDAIWRPQITIPAHVGKEDDVGGLEDLGDRLVLGAVDHAALELLGEGVQVLHVLELGPRHVDHDDRLLVVAVRHVLHAALQQNGAVLQNQVLGQPGLPAVAGGVVHPEDVAVVGVSGV